MGRISDVMESVHGILDRAVEKQRQIEIERKKFWTDLEEWKKRQDVAQKLAAEAAQKEAAERVERLLARADKAKTGRKSLWVNPMTDIDRAMIINLRARGWVVRRIAEAVGRSTNACFGVIYTAERAGVLEPQTPKRVRAEKRRAAA